ncbi:MAG: LysR family transcriptional regulator [Candidatus Nephthysia bennettiae]|uniref:LysR family transcriptional regulator n=1 Tax=Candidatus Nephthysia bennettiae TaxID=3127016 RepID=A0A934K8I3_9BACT|nr:LysR family transcriptional regulator [Candidatus Dormibacteraeota bacterium]MBJ7611501.1 LysR family transcriptional regulator [Candidatus Dormibacteraeota bacterium]PZR99294.1 MAG: LysR family transcriptional regulator [Candidatus Dormibacteraeota bacterium]
MAEPRDTDRTMTLHQLRTFRAVADQLSFSAAASELNLSQPSVSYQVKELEEVLGVSLLDRLGKRVRLTEAGEILYGYTQRTLNLLDEAALVMGQLRGIERGTLRVGASATVGIYVVPLALGAYKRQHPKLAVSLEIGFREQLESRLRGGAIDLAVMSLPFTDPDLEATPFMEDELVMVLPPGHSLASRKGLSLSDFQEESFLMREPGSGTRVAVEQAARSAGVSLQVGMELGSNGAIKHAVEAGLGVAVLSRHAIELERREGGLVVVDVAGLPIRRQWSVIRLRRRRLPGPVQGFIEFLSSGEWPAR